MSQVSKQATSLSLLSSSENRKSEIRRAIIKLAKAKFQEQSNWNGRNNDDHENDDERTTTILVAKCLAPISPTPPKIISKILPMLGLSSRSVILDLGCGDGRWIIMAAKEYKCRAIGCDLDPERLAIARAQVKEKNLSSLVQIYQKDVMDYICTTNILQEVNAIVVYLFREAMSTLSQKLQQNSIQNITPHSHDNAAICNDKEHCLKIISIGFSLPSWSPSWQGQEGGIHFYIYNAIRNKSMMQES